MAVDPLKSTDDLRQKISQLESLVETISRSKIMWESTFDVITDPVMIINRHYQIKRANKAMARACGRDIRDLINKTCYQEFAGYEKPCPKCPVKATLESNDPHSAELDMFPAERQYNVNAYHMPQLSSDLDESIVLHYRDITGERQLQRKLMQTEKMAAIGTLAGGVAHEINNPLGGILAFVQLIRRSLDKDHPCLEDLKEIEDAALRCKKIVRNLLDFSRQSHDEEMVPVTLGDVIHRSMSLIKFNMRQHRVKINLDLAPELPPIKGDVQKLQQVVLNLVTNAIQAMKDDGGTVWLSTFADQDRVFLRIRDTGIGIDKSHIDRIFDPFFTTKEQGEGTGLGLSICYRIIEEHQGKIDVDSEPGQGTVVTLQFPAVRS